MRFVKLCLVLMVTFFAFSGLALKEQTYLEGKLNQNWAQVVTGADLALEYLRIPRIERSLFTARVGIIDAPLDQNYVWLESFGRELQAVYKFISFKSADSEFWGSDPKVLERHGVSIVNLLVGPPNIRWTAKSILTHYANASIADFLEQSLDFGYFPQVVNISIGMSRFNPETLQALSHQIENNNLLVAANAGNDFIFPPKASPTAGVIYVGSVNPFGLVSDFTTEPTDTFSIDVYAPGDIFLTTIGGYARNEVSPFGGTSGASPVVASVLANLKSLLPTISEAEARVILHKTMLSPYALIQAQRTTNKVGLINAYKVIRVADRLRISGYQNLEKASRLSVLERQSLYDFSAECNDMGESLSSSQTTDYRKCFFLTADEKFASRVSAYYADRGLDVDAAFFRSFTREGALGNIELSKDLALKIYEDYRVRFKNPNCDADRFCGMSRQSVGRLLAAASRSSFLMGASGVEVIKKASQVGIPLFNDNYVETLFKAAEQADLPYRPELMRDIYQSALNSGGLSNLQRLKLANRSKALGASAVPLLKDLMNLAVKTDDMFLLSESQAVAEGLVSSGVVNRHELEPEIDFSAF